MTCEFLLTSTKNHLTTGSGNRIFQAMTEIVADQSPPSSGELKNSESYTSTPPYVFMAWRTTGTALPYNENRFLLMDKPVSLLRVFLIGHFADWL
jgi:hypothetical protein